MELQRRGKADRTFAMILFIVSEAYKASEILMTPPFPALAVIAFEIPAYNADEDGPCSPDHTFMGTMLTALATPQLFPAMIPATAVCNSEETSHETSRK
jgi:hypothetical protein